MSSLTLIYEPESSAHVRFYGEAIARALPGHEFVATSDRAEILARAAEATALIAKAQDVSAEFVAAMPKLGWIQALTTGVDPLLKLTLPPSIVVTSGRGIHGPQMAELALLLMMSLYRDFPRMLANQRGGRWERWGQRLLLGKTVVILGVGTISEAIAARCRPFGLKVLGVSSRREAEGFDELYPRERLVEVAARADFLVVVVPYSVATHHMIGAEVLGAMKQSAYLINIARGNVIDERALIKALEERRIAGAGLDVFAVEPLPATSPLWSMKNVIVTPHIGGMSDIYAEQILPVLLHNLRAWIGGDLDAMQNRVALQR
jgi:D-2-hydroxyacid dehydrogenase (NADP+)